MIELMFITMMGLGILLGTWKEMDTFYRERASRIADWLRSFRTGGETLSEKSKKNPVESHIRLLLQITLGLGTEKSLKAFWVLSVLPGAALLLVLISKIPFTLTVCASVLTMSMPYGLLRLKLQRMRVESSREGEILITELLNNYKICFLNMQQAIEETARTIEDAPNSRRLLFNLSKGLNRAGGSSRISQLLEEFRLSINTSWGNIMTSNMYFALASGLEVTEALTDLAETIKRARKVDEYARRENNEAGLILKYLAPVSYFFTVAGGIGFFGLSPEKFLYYQFKTEVGLTWFTVSAVIYAAGILANGYLTKTKLDF